MKIKSIEARKILDSRGSWTIETEITLEDSSKGLASVPSGTSKGKFEAVYQDPEFAIEKIKNVISPALREKDIKNQEELDRILLELDGTENKSKLGANSILSISIAFCKASAILLKLPLYKHISQINSPQPQSNYKIPNLMVLMFEGGKHGDSNLSIQEFMYVLKSSADESRIFNELKDVLKSKKLDTDTGLEGAYSPSGISDEEVIKIMSDLHPDIPIALDVAESSRSGENVTFRKLLDNFNIKSIEDPCGEEDWNSWVDFNNEYGEKILIVADDLTATNPKRLEKAIELKAANSVIVKPNQIGSVTETLETVKLAKKAGWKVIVSHRSGETNDDFLADLAVGVEADFVKFGAPNRGERVAKYNRLLEISTQITSTNVQMSKWQLSSPPRVDKRTRVEAG